MKAFSRTLNEALLKSKIWNNKNGFTPKLKRTLATQAQRRKASTTTDVGLRFPVVDHHYE